MIPEPQKHIVDRFVQARAERPRWSGIPPNDRPERVEDGYAVQAAVHRRMTATGVRLKGYKVGSTSRAGQKIYGLSEPVYAGIFDRTLFPTLRAGLAGLVAPSVECEIALVLAADIDGSSSEIAPSDLAEACAACHLACEIIDNRYGDPLAVGVPSLLADDFFHAGYVLGPPVEDWRARSLDALNAVVEIDGAVHTGNPGDILPPFDSLLWLARKLAANGQTLRAGQVVLTGTIVPPAPVPSDVKSVSLAIEGFGRLTLDTPGMPS